jgi:hypothetical protein
MATVYCIDKEHMKVLSSGPVPEVWGTISGMKDLTAEVLADLSWAGYPFYGFLSRDAALAVNIPEADLNNADYLYKKLTVPEKITLRQARLALLNLNLLDLAETVISNIQDTTKRRAAQINWEYAEYINRTSDLVSVLEQGLPLTVDQMDDLFIAAAVI